MREQRSLKNLLVNPSRQFRLLVGMSLVSGLTYLTSMFFIISGLISDVAKETVNYETQPLLQQKIILLLQNSFFPICLTGVVLIFVLSLIVVVISHRFFGPVVAIRNFVQQIRQGNYAARISIRESDELHDLVADLNEMAIQLEKKNFEKQ